MSKFKLNIVTPEGVVYNDKAEMVSVRTIDGDRGFLANHQPLVTGLEIGEIKVKKTADKEDKLAATKGYMEVKPAEINILVEAAELSENIDIERAEDAKNRAEDRLKEINKDYIDKDRAEVALQKSLNRLRVSKGRNFE